MLDAAQVVVHDVVAPAVQLVRRLRRAVGEREERAVERMRVRQLRERAGAGKRRAASPARTTSRTGRRRRDCSRRRTAARRARRSAAGRSRSARAEAHQLVAGHEQERKRQQLVGVGGDDDFLLVDRDRRVLRRPSRGRWRRPSGCSPSRRSRSAGARTRTRDRGACLDGGGLAWASERCASSSKSSEPATPAAVPPGNVVGSHPRGSMYPVMKWAAARSRLRVLGLAAGRRSFRRGQPSPRGGSVGASLRGSCRTSAALRRS